MRPQHTLARTISCEGIGLHTGLPVTLTIAPAAPDTGLVFVRRGEGEPVFVKASVCNLLATELCTAISVNGTSIKTIEHVLSALVGLEVDNAYVEVNAPEVPVLDGSAAPFVKLLKDAGIVPQNKRQPFLKIIKPIEVSDRGKRVQIKPAASTRITYTIQYDHPLIKTQTYTFDWSVEAFEREIAGARTFGFFQEVEMLWARGLAKGGSLENTVVLTEKGVMNESGLRFNDEFVRHKVLDLVGDVALLGLPVIGHITADRSGHALHTKLVETILRQPDCWTLVQSEPVSGSAQVKPATVVTMGHAPAMAAAPAR
ncbi:MAG: UDP-3-O-acyl-N-acetylglucosamine deacetylase [Nitrospira sp.]